MKILLDVTHPADVHFFKYAIRIWQARGHRVLITARDKDVTVELLESLGLEFVSLGRASAHPWGTALELLTRGTKIYRIAREERPDVLVSSGGVFITHVGKLLRVPTVVFADTEHARLAHLIALPLASSINTPSCFTADLGARQTRYPGYKELAYLHPNRFTPSTSLPARLDIDGRHPLFVLRFVSWSAHHDVGQHGFTPLEQRKLVAMLAQRGTVVISRESQPLRTSEGRRLSARAEDIHDLLYHATLYVGEGGTMAAEAAVLGTPSIFVSTLTLGYLAELERQFRLVHVCSDGHAGIELARDLLERHNLKAMWAERRRGMLEEKIDVTPFVADQVERHARNAERLPDGVVQCGARGLPTAAGLDRRLPDATSDAGELDRAEDA